MLIMHNLKFECLMDILGLFPGTYMTSLHMWMVKIILI
jgi:hypothetical protein